MLLTTLALFAGPTEARNKAVENKRKANDVVDVSTAGLSSTRGGSRPRLSALGGERHTFEVANDTFLLDGEPFRILSGE